MHSVLNTYYWTRSFSCAGPSAWNQLPTYTKDETPHKHALLSIRLNVFYLPHIVSAHGVCKIFYSNDRVIYTGRAKKKSNPLGKILYLWHYSRYLYQICRVYSWGFSPHILQILLK